MISKKLIIIIVSAVATLAVGATAFLTVSFMSDADKSHKDKGDEKKSTTVEVGGENVGEQANKPLGNLNASRFEEGNVTENIVDGTVASEDKVVNTTAPMLNGIEGTQGGNAGNNQPKPPVQEAPVPDNTAEIVAYYKNAVNYAKTNGKTVILVKDGVLNYNGIVEAGELSSVAESLMGMFMSPSEAEISVKNESCKSSDIPPSGINCNLTVSGVKSASIKDNGNTYTVTIVAKDCVNPAPGSDGVGSLVNVIKAETIVSSVGSAPGLELNNISISYENVTVTAVIDKATGGLTSLKINAPSVLSLDAKLAMLAADNSKVGIQCISEYTIAY